MRREDKPQAKVLIGEGMVTIVRRTSAQAVVCKVLGVEDDGRTIYLDRLVHSPWELQLGEWLCEGAISTILRIQAES